MLVKQSCLKTANKALALLGQYKIDSWNPVHKTVYNEICELFMEDAVKGVLFDGEWTFLRRRLILDALTDEEIESYKWSEDYNPIVRANWRYVFDPMKAFRAKAGTEDAKEIDDALWTINHLPAIGRILYVNGSPWEQQSQFISVETVELEKQGGVKTGLPEQANIILYANQSKLDLIYLVDPAVYFWTADGQDPYVYLKFPENVWRLIELKLAILSCLRICNNTDLQTKLEEKYDKQVRQVRDYDKQNDYGQRYNYRNRLLGKVNLERIPHGLEIPLSNKYFNS